MKSLDRIDRHLLTLLQNDARLTNKELANAVGLAPSSCLQRVRRLRDEGIIRGFHADVDPSAVGLALQALIVVRLRDHAREHITDVWAHLRGLAEVVDLFYVAGADDFLVHVNVRDTAALHDFVLDKVSSHKQIVQVETSLVFSRHRGAVPIPLAPN